MCIAKNVTGRNLEEDYNTFDTSAPGIHVHEDM